MKIYENDEIYVRPLLESDIEKESYQQWFYDQEICKYNSHGKMSHRDLLRTIDPESSIVWAVMAKEKGGYSPSIGYSDLHIGNVELSIDWINRNAEFTCIFGEKKYWGKGYCTQVLKWIIEHGFNKLNLHKIWLGTAQYNCGMMTAARKSGMHNECILLDELFIENQYQSVYRWVKIND